MKDAVLFFRSFFWHFEANTVTIGFCDHPPSERSRSLNPARPLKPESGYSILVRVCGKNVFVFMPAGFSDHYGRYLLYKSQISRSLYPRLLFMY